jgi:hypothetical protein
VAGGQCVGFGQARPAAARQQGGGGAVCVSRAMSSAAAASSHRVWPNGAHPSLPRVVPRLLWCACEAGASWCGEGGTVQTTCVHVQGSARLQQPGQSRPSEEQRR